MATITLDTAIDTRRRPADDTLGARLRALTVSAMSALRDHDVELRRVPRAPGDGIDEFLRAGVPHV